MAETRASATYRALARILGPGHLGQNGKPRSSVSGSAAKHQWEERIELASRIVAVRLVLGQSQTQQEAGPRLETLWIKGYLLKRPHEMAPSVTIDDQKVRHVFKSPLELPHHNAGIHLCQCGEHLRTSRRAKPLNAAERTTGGEPFNGVERATVTTNMVNDFLRNRSRVEPRKLLRRTHLQVCKPLGHVHRHIRCGLPSQDFVPIRPAPVPPLTFGQPHRDRTRLKGDRSSPAPRDAAVEQKVEGSPKIGIGKSAAPGGHLGQLFPVGIIDANQCEGGKESRGLQEHVGLPGRAPEKEGLDEVVVGGVGEGTVPGPGLNNEVRNLRKAHREAGKAPRVLVGQAWGNTRR